MIACIRCGGPVPPGEEGLMSGMCQTCLNGALPAAGLVESPQDVTYQEAILDGADPTEGFYE